MIVMLNAPMLPLRMQLSLVYIGGFYQAGTQEIIVFTSTTMVCKHRAIGKQERGGFIGVCVAVWITRLQQIAAGEHVQLRL